MAPQMDSIHARISCLDYLLNKTCVCVLVPIFMALLHHRCLLDMPRTVSAPPGVSIASYPVVTGTLCISLSVSSSRERGVFATLN